MVGTSCAVTTTWKGSLEAGVYGKLERIAHERPASLPSRIVDTTEERGTGKAPLRGLFITRRSIKAVSWYLTMATGTGDDDDNDICRTIDNACNLPSGGGGGGSLGGVVS